MVTLLTLASDLVASLRRQCQLLLQRRMGGAPIHHSRYIPEFHSRLSACPWPQAAAQGESDTRHAYALALTDHIKVTQ